MGSNPYKIKVRNWVAKNAQRLQRSAVMANRKHQATLVRGQKHKGMVE